LEARAASEIPETREGLFFFVHRSAPARESNHEEPHMSDLDPSGLSDNAAGGLAYFTIIPAIIFLIVEPYKKRSFVRFHAWQSIFFLVAWAVIDILVNMLQNLGQSSVFLTLTVIQLVRLALFVVWIVVIINAFNGKRFKLPVLGKLAEKQAGL
jgi:uncharacterized membrane protein